MDVRGEERVSRGGGGEGGGEEIKSEHLWEPKVIEAASVGLLLKIWFGLRLGLFCSNLPSVNPPPPISRVDSPTGWPHASIVFGSSTSELHRPETSKQGPAVILRPAAERRESRKEEGRTGGRNAPNDGGKSGSWRLGDEQLFVPQPLQ